MSGAVRLSGGSTVVVDPDRLDALAGPVTALARAIEQQIIGTLARLNQPGAASVVDPVGSAEVLTRSAAALALAATLLSGCLALAASLRSAAAGYREADGLRARIEPLLRALQALPAATAALARGHYQQALTDDPELADAGVQLLSNLDPGLTAAQRLGPDASLRTAAGLASLYRDPGPVVTARPDGATTDGVGPPRSVAGLLQDVAVREADDEAGGAVDVRILDGPHGRRVVVDIAGTTSWQLDPGAAPGQASDIATNLRSLANEPSVLTRGVRQALRQAGVSSTDPIMLVGHSQGGMVAAVLATELSRDREFTVTQLVTAGSPIGLAGVPASVSVLSLENRGDVVPQLDGADNPDRSNWLTARVDEGGDGVLARHSVNSYVQGAADFDRDRDHAVKDWQSGADDFLDATGVHTTVFQVGRN